MFTPLENLGRYSIKLASHSPRRQELLKMLDIEFTIPEIPEIDEIVPDGLLPENVPLYLAELKANAYKGKMGENDLFITADTVVILGDEIIGKPSDETDARHMIAKLSGNTHTVVTGVCITSAERCEKFKVATKVEFAELTDAEIDYYISHYRPLDKAGAYGIQEWIGGAAIKRIEGSFYNVMGLPLHALYRHLQKF